MISTKKKLGICILSLLLGFLISALSLVTYAYFSKKEIYDGYISGQVELLFDRLNDDGIEAYSQAEGIVADKEAIWGTRANPYVISDARHLYNLSELQNLGYFERGHLSKNTETDLSNIPYFLICTPDYTPVVVDGSSFKAISPIGNGKHPFIGSVKGVTGASTVTVGTNQTVCDTSVIHKVSVKGNPNETDIGLFGYVGFLGTPPEEGSEDIQFRGTPSVISNFVLSDVTVSVNSTLWDKVTAFMDDIVVNQAEGHRYSFSELYDGGATDAYSSVPHENHHIGILAGHVSYSTVEYISVFYSKGDIPAIDLSDVTDINEDGTYDANYLSCAGILGFIYNLNPSFNEGTGELTAGSGDSIGDLSYSMIGGGGLESGGKPGYVLASSMYRAYGYDANGNKIPEGSDLKLSEAYDQNNNPLTHEWIRDRLFGLGTTPTGEYYFYDGVFTFALSDKNDIIDSTWDGEVSEFALGENSENAWHTNTSEGQKAVSAYLKQVKNDEDLQKAIQSGTPLVIVKESDSGVFLMSLYNQSDDSEEGSFNERYTTDGTDKDFATEEKIRELIMSYEEGSEEAKQKFIEGFGEGYDAERVEEILNLLKNDTDGENWKVIELSRTPGSMTTEQLEEKVKELREQYKVIGGYTEGKDVHFAGNTPVTVTNGQLQDYYDYSTSGYNGYITYVEYRHIWGTRYAYYWISLDGTTVEEINKQSSDAPTRYLTNSGESWQGETVYYRQNTSYKGVLINLDTGNFYSGNTAYASGSSLTKPANKTYSYLFSPPGDDNYYLPTDTKLDNPISISELQLTERKTEANLPIYLYGGVDHVLLDKYFVYDFYLNDNHLRIIKASVPTIFTIPLINYEIIISSKPEYTLWNGNDDEAKKPDNFKIGNTTTVSGLENSKDAIVRFNPDGTCYIQYTLGGTAQYVNYNGNAFNTALSTTESTKLCIYTLEATQALNFGVISFDPNESTDNHTLRADEYVFWPEAESIEVATPGTESSVTGANTQYSVISLEELAWHNGDASDNRGILHGGNLTNKFHMTDGITFGLTVDFGGTLGTSGIIRAPVGTAGTETNIPTGCVAFRINKSGTEPQKIRVIIAVPVSDYFIGEDNYDLGSFDRYFCLWNMEEAGESFATIFRSSDYIERFAIPRSHFYEPGTTTASENSEFVTVTYDGKEYRSYLNGDRVLLAYEFKVYNEGVYVLGTSTGSSDASDFEDRDTAPMEIVYFSADGVASTGRDGLSGSQLGTVDYVYSYDNKIVPVTDSSSADASGEEDYSTYYPSYCIMYMNSVPDDPKASFVNVNSEKVYIRRFITETPSSNGDYLETDSKAVIAFSLERDRYTRLAQYSRLADNVQKE